MVRLYLSLLTESRNFNTLEAAAGALQNLSAGNWVVRGRAWQGGAEGIPGGFRVKAGAQHGFVRRGRRTVSWR